MEYNLNYAILNAQKFSPVDIGYSMDGGHVGIPAQNLHLQNFCLIHVHVGVITGRKLNGRIRMQMELSHLAILAKLMTIVMVFETNQFG